MINPEALAQAFRKHFLQYGFAKTSVDQVAADLKISKRTIYQLFESKEEIRQFIIGAQAEAWRLVWLERLEPLPSFQEKLFALVRCFWEQAQELEGEPGDLAAVHLAALEEPALQQALQKALLHLCKLARVQGQSNQELLPEDQASYAQALVRTAAEQHQGAKLPPGLNASLWRLLSP